jgi:1,4-dihydroxy-2-naphthoate octaprenyltransferase
MPSVKQWIIASRPKLMPASIIPVLLGLSAAYHDIELDNDPSTSFNYITAIITLLCGIGIQVVTNFVNDIYDFKKGVDKDDRLGPERAVAKGIISIEQMKVATIVVATVTLILGFYLVIYLEDYLILATGVISLFLAYGYTAGPAPLSYLGIGDLFVLIFFGIVATNGTYYIQTGVWSNEVFWMSLPLGFFATNILGVNNIRDVGTDKRAGKLTLPVRIGIKNAIMLYVVLTCMAYFSGSIVLFMMNDYVFALPLLTLPLGFKMCLDIYRKTGSELNKVLVGTALLMTFYGMLMMISLITTTVMRN